MSYWWFWLCFTVLWLTIDPQPTIPKLSSLTNNHLFAPHSAFEPDHGLFLPHGVQARYIHLHSSGSTAEPSWPEHPTKPHYISGYDTCYQLDHFGSPPFLSPGVQTGLFTLQKKEGKGLLAVTFKDHRPDRGTECIITLSRHIFISFLIIKLLLHFLTTPTKKSTIVLAPGLWCQQSSIPVPDWFNPLLHTMILFLPFSMQGCFESLLLFGSRRESFVLPGHSRRV